MAETVVSLGVLAIALSLLGHNLVGGFTSVVAGRQRQVATALANEMLEQVRALPFDQLDMGNADLAASVAAGEEGLAVSGTGANAVYTFRGREIPRAEIASRPPLVPHASAVTNEPSATTYTRRLYVTRDPTNAGGRIATAVVSWTMGARGIVPQVEVETVITGYRCAAQEGPRPCESYWFASATGGGGSGRIAGRVLDESDATVSLTLPKRTAQLTTEQLTAVTSNATVSGIEVQHGETTPLTYGGDSSSAAADDSLATTQGIYDGPALVSSGASAGQLTRTAGSVTATLNGVVGEGDTAGAAAAAVAIGQVPPMGGGPLDNDNLGYGRAAASRGSSVGLSTSVTAEGTTAALTALGAGDGDGATGTAVADRNPGASLSTSDDDILRSSVSHSLGSGTLSLMTLPDAVSLVTVAGWTATATAAAGPGASASTTAASQSGTLTYWDGAAHVPLDLGAAVEIDLPARSVTAGACTHEVSGARLTAGGTSTSVESAAGAISHARASVNPISVRGVSYTVTCAGERVLDLAIDLDLGATVAEARFSVPGA